MILKVNGIFTYDDTNFSKNKLSDEVYDETIFIANKEIDISNTRSKSMVFNPASFAHKRSLELINSIANIKMDDENYSFLTNSGVANVQHRRNFTFSSELQKQIFINNFIFPENEKFVESLKKCNITKEQIDNLINAIIMKKKVARVSKNYELDINSIVDLESTGDFYGFHIYEVIVNKIYEIYYKYPELLRILEDTKKR